MPDDNIDVWSLTPQQATERLAAMKPAAPAADPSKPVNIDAMSAAQARVHFNKLSADPAWTERFLNGGMAEQKELAAVMERKGDTKLDQAIEHGDEGVPYFETTFSGALNSAKLAKVVTHLKELGLESGHIREAFNEDLMIDRTTYDAAKRLERERFSDADYVKRYLAGGAAEKREMSLLRIVLGMKVAEATAA
jgi:hypothetical protein